MSMTVKKGDNVVVIAGKDKGKTGKVQEVFPESNRVLVEGINIVTKHKKARSQQEKSAKVKMNAPIDASNVMVVCPSCGKATRVYHKVIDGKKVRVCKCGVSLDKAYVKATKKDAKKTKTESSVKEEKVEVAAPKTAKTTEKVAKSTEKTVKTAAKTEKAPAKATEKTAVPAAKSAAGKTTKTTSGEKSTTQKSNKQTSKKDA